MRDRSRRRRRRREGGMRAEDLLVGHGPDGLVAVPLEVLELRLGQEEDQSSDDD